MRLDASFFNHGTHNVPIMIGLYTLCPKIIMMNKLDIVFGIGFLVQMHYAQLPISTVDAH